MPGRGHGIKLPGYIPLSAFGIIRLELRENTYDYSHSRRGVRLPHFEAPSLTLEVVNSSVFL